MIIQGKELKDKIKEALEKLTAPVRSTMGAKGTNVGVIDPVLHRAHIINDGIRVAQAVKFEDKVLSFLADIFTRVSKETDDTSGDGTTTALVLASAFILKGLESGMDSDQMMKELDELLDISLGDLSDMVTPCTNELLEKITSISANNDKELGQMVADIYKAIGANGKLEVRRSPSRKTYFTLTQGSKYDVGIDSLYYVNSEANECRFSDAAVLIIDDQVTDIRSLQGVLNHHVDNQKPLVIIADGYDPKVLTTITNEVYKFKHKICTVTSPGVGSNKHHVIADLGFICNAKVISFKDLDTLDGTELGNVTEFIGTLEDFTVVSEKPKEELKEYADQILSHKTADKNENKELTDRVSQVTQSMAVVYIGGNSVTEIQDKILRLEDSKNAAVGALEEGILPGGGVALRRVAEQIGKSNFFSPCLLAPYKQILDNANITSVDAKLFGNNGYNVKTGSVCDMIEEGIIDPAKVTKTALRNAASVSKMILNMKYIVL